MRHRGAGDRKATIEFRGNKVVEGGNNARPSRVFGDEMGRVDENLQVVIEAVRSDPHDAVAVTSLVAAARPFACRVASHLVDDAAVDDVAQDATLDMLVLLPHLREVDAFHGWFRSIVRKHADRHRRRQRPVVELDDELVALSPTPHDLAERAQLVGIVRDALGYLRDRDRLLLDLKYVAEWDDRQLADALGITAGAVRKRLFDARRRLRPLLAAHLELQATLPRQEVTVPFDRLFGSVLRPAELRSHLPPDPLRTDRPVSFTPLETGFPVIDLLVPLPRGGVAAWRAGSLYLINELVGNLAAGAPAALVAVGARRPLPNGIYHRFHRLVGPTDTASLIVVVDARDDDDALDSVRAGAELAAAIASEGTETILALDAVLSAEVDSAQLRALGGLVGRGAVTVLTITDPAIATIVDLDAPALLDRPIDTAGVDAVVSFTTTELVRGMSPPVDLEHSWSSALVSPAMGGERGALAAAARELLTRSAKLRVALSQPFDHGETWSGHSARHIRVEEALGTIAPLLRDVQ